jgi:TetR/AcrR family transcriptional regulator, ethionamide resistance regulator
MASRPAAARRRNARVRRDEARTRIAAAAERLLAERPYRDLSVDAVMAEAGLSRTVFYRHFDGLPELVLFLFESVAAGLAAELETGELRQILDAAANAFHAHGPLLRAIDQAASHDAVIERAYRSISERFTARMGEQLAERMDEGRVRPGDPLELARALNLMNQRYLLETVARDPGFEPERAVRTLLDVWEPVLGG